MINFQATRTTSAPAVMQRKAVLMLKIFHLTNQGAKAVKTDRSHGKGYVMASKGKCERDGIEDQVSQWYPISTGSVFARPMTRLYYTFYPKD